jgi:protein-tyrosine phosphatase
MNLIRPYLYIGGYRDTLNAYLLHSVRIGAMLQFAEPVRHPGIETLYLNVDDGVPLPPAILERGVAFAREQVARLQPERKALLISCGAGISRSVTFGMALLHELEGIPLSSAYHTIRLARPEALPHPALLETLHAYYAVPEPFEDFWRGIWE